MGLLSKLFGPKTDYKALVADGALIVDVRTVAEYRSGHIEGSRNIPLDQIASKVKELKKSGKPVITVCRSGARSGMARTTLERAGITAYNGGPWNSLLRKIS